MRFKDWMISEMVVVAYHGSPISNLTQITTTHDGKYQRVAGVYFSKEKKAAAKYSKVKGVPQPNGIYQVELHLDNPASREALNKIPYSKNGIETRLELIHMGYDSLVDDYMGEIVIFYPDKQIKNLQIAK